MKKNTIYSLIAIAVIIGGGLLIIHTFFGSFNPFYVVVSGSMIPTINIGDIVIIKNNSFDTSFNNLKIGDIIVFRAAEAKTDDGKPKVIVHRIADIGTFFEKKVLKSIFYSWHRLSNIYGKLCGKSSICNSKNRNDFNDYNPSDKLHHYGNYNWIVNLFH
jgi:signal peptidase I